MKKLRATIDEKENMLNEIKQSLEDYTKGSIEDFKIDSIIKSYSTIDNSKIVRPIITITPSAYVKMLELVRQSPVECSWHGLVRYNAENEIYTVYDILVFPQINSPTTTSTDEEDFAKWQQDLIMDMNFPIQDLRMHGHSHVNMNVFSSGVDDKYQKDLITKVEDGDYYIFMIFNKSMDLCCLLYDFRQQILFENDDIYVTVYDEVDICAWAQTELEDKAKRAVTTYYNKSKKNKSNIYSDDPFDYDLDEYFVDKYSKKPKKESKGGKHYGFK